MRLPVLSNAPVSKTDLQGRAGRLEKVLRGLHRKSKREEQVQRKELSTIKKQGVMTSAKLSVPRAEVRLCFQKFLHQLA